MARRTSFLGIDPAAVEHWLVWYTARASRSFGITRPAYATLLNQVAVLSASFLLHGKHPTHKLSVPARHESECLAYPHAPGPRILASRDISTEINSVLLADLEP